MPIQFRAASHQLLGDREGLKGSRRADQGVDHVNNRCAEVGRRLSRVQAPRKEFVWFENSGHFPFFEEQQKFADELERLVARR